jgi:hypothetical protein
MMLDISELVQAWILCSNDVWRKWFLNREHGAHEFEAIEDKLLEVLVLGRVIGREPMITSEEFIARVRVRFVRDVNESRLVCRRQRAGDIFGQSEPVTISKGCMFSVQSIDTAGTMLNSEPYVEVPWQSGFILEPPKNLEFLFEET